MPVPGSSARPAAADLRERSESRSGREYLALACEAPAGTVRGADCPFARLCRSRAQKQEYGYNTYNATSPFIESGSQTQQWAFSL